MKSVRKEPKFLEDHEIKTRKSSWAVLKRKANSSLGLQQELISNKPVSVVSWHSNGKGRKAQRGSWCRNVKAWPALASYGKPAV